MLSLRSLIIIYDYFHVGIFSLVELSKMESISLINVKNDKRRGMSRATWNLATYVYQLGVIDYYDQCGLEFANEWLNKV